MTRLLMLSTLMFLLGGCGMIQDVKPWEKDQLAKETLTPAGSDTNLHAFRKHLYFSKEASKGGGGVAGGGCGCN